MSADDGGAPFPVRSVAIGTVGLDAAGVAPAGRPAGPRYQRLGALGEGAMGTVHLGWDAWLQRNVALKVPSGGPGSAAERVLRAEATRTARLDHPGIAAIHDVGEDDDGRTFFVMRLVRGRPLGDLIDAGDHGEAVRAVIAAAEAVAHAHARGVVHRDLSASNVLVAPHGDVAVVDWGVAADAGDAAAPGPVGTPGTTAPEQAEGAIPDPRADVWSLGALLRAAAAADAGPELLAIAARATDPDPAGRYPDAAALAADLRAWQDGRRVAAYAYRPAELAWRLVRAWRVPLGVGAIALVALAAQAGWSAAAVRAERDRAVEAEVRAVASLSAALGREAFGAWTGGDDVVAASRAAQALAVGDDPLAVGVAMATEGMPSPVPITSQALPHCQHWMLPGDGRVAVCRAEGAADVVLPDGQRWQFPRTVVDARIDGDDLVLLDRERHAYRLDWRDGTELGVDRLVGEFAEADGVGRTSMYEVAPADLIPPGACPGRVVRWRGGEPRWLACYDGSVVRVDDGVRVTRVVPPGEVVYDGGFAVADGAVWAASHQGALRRVDADRGVLDLGEPVVRMVALPGTGRLLVVGRRERVRLLDAHTGRWLLDLPPGAVDATIDSDGRLVRVDGDTWSWWALPDALPVRSWRGRYGISGAAWGASGLMVGDGGGTAYRIDPWGREPVEALRWQDRVVKTIAATPDGGFVLSAMGPEGVQAWHPATGLRSWTTAWRRYKRLVVGTDGVVTGAAFEGYINRLDGPQVVQIDSTERFPQDMALDGDGVSVLLAADDALWRVTPDDTVTRLGPGPVHAVAAHPRWRAQAVDAQIAVSGDDVATWAHPTRVTDMVWLASGLLVTGGLDGVVRVWRPDGTAVATLPAHGDRVGVFALSPDGAWLASAGWDGVVRILSTAPLDGRGP